MIIKSKDQQTITTSHGKHLKKVILGKEIVPPLLQFACSEFKRGDIIEKHSHDSMTEVFYILNGKLEILLENKTQVIEKGDCVVIRAKESHSFNFLEKTEFIYFSLSDENSDS